MASTSVQGYGDGSTYWDKRYLTKASPDAPCQHLDGQDTQDRKPDEFCDQTWHTMRNGLPQEGRQQTPRGFYGIGMLWVYYITRNHVGFHFGCNLGRGMALGLEPSG